MIAFIRGAVASALFGLFAPAAQAWPGDIREIRTGRVERLLDNTEIDTGALDEKLTFEKLLEVLSGRLPKGGGLGFGFDRAALGDDAAKLAALPIHIRRFGSIPLQSVLQDALDQVPPGIEVDYALRPTGVILTRPRLAARAATYEIGDALRVQGRFLSDRDGKSGPMTRERLGEFLTTNAHLRPWEAIDLLNGRRLSVFATPSRQHTLGQLIGSLTRLADLGIYMNARLYSVDRRFYTATIAPLIAGRKGEPAPVAVQVERPVLDKILKQSVIQEGDDTKLAPERTAVFLARERFVPGVGMTGVSVAVRPEVSPDRRHLRLHLTQVVAELVTPGRANGPDRPADESTVRKSTIAGTVDIRDGEAILVPVDFRPPSADREGKVWILVARPLIWIEAEERERAGGYKPRDIWDGAEMDDLARELQVRAKPVPATDDAKAILQAVLSHVLTSKDVAGTREFYGTDADHTILLSNTGNWEWPEGFRPDLHGFKLVMSRPGPFAPVAKRNRVLGVRIDRFEPDAKWKGLFDAPIEICLFNAGGSANGGVIGGCSVFYSPKKVDKKWVVQFEGLVDP